VRLATLFSPPLSLPRQLPLEPLASARPLTARAAAGQQAHDSYACPCADARTMDAMAVPVEER
jgi:hypothetical protein